MMKNAVRMKAATLVRISPSKRCLHQNPGVIASVSTLRKSSIAAGSKSLTTWGFIGLGRMGYPMAKNLRARIPEGDRLVIYDRNEDTTSRFLHEISHSNPDRETFQRGTVTEVASQARKVVEKSDTIITVLPDSSHVQSVFDSIREPALPPSTVERLFIDCSTIDPSVSREIAKAIHRAEQGHFVDAPMSGGVVGAQAGTLTFMFGAPSQPSHLVERVRSILKLMGSRVLHMGEQGMGLSGKLANNYLLAISNIATAEAMNMGVRWGLDPARLGELINGSSGRCWASQVNNPVAGVSVGAPAERAYDGGFAVGLMRKDLRLAVEAARKVNARLELAGRATEVYEALDAQESGKDFSVVYKWLGGGGKT